MFKKIQNIEDGLTYLEKLLQKKFKNSVEYYEIKKDSLSYSEKKDTKTIIYYSNTNELYKLLFDNLSGSNIANKKYNCPFNRLGIMLDCARNGVPSISGLKKFIASIACLGYTYLGLYFEDCFEVDNEPFFGYMRGRYTKNELVDIVNFASCFGVEIVPYIQTLAHISRIFNHYDVYTAKIRDTNDILLIDEPRTYQLVENEIATISTVFQSKYVNIGMDEAFLMGLGKYREIHGIVDRKELLLRHAGKICDICKKYGLTPIAYSDTFVRLYSKDTVIPDNLILNVWNYSANCEDKDNPLNLIKNEKTFSSGIHKWYGYAPLNEFSQGVVLPAISYAKTHYKDFSISLWGDDGDECSYNSVWYSLIKASSNIFDEDNNTVNDNKSLLLTGYTLQELLCLDLPNKVFDCQMKRPINISKYLLFEDLFYGVADKADSKIYTKYFKKNKEILKNLSNKKSNYSYIFDELYKLCAVLEQKNDLRIDLLNAYKNKDIKALESLYKEKLPVLIVSLRSFSKSVEKCWGIEKKPFGFEVQTIRLSGLIARLIYIKNKVKKFVLGKIKRIEELDEINLSPLPRDDEYNGASLFNNYEMNVTYGNITHRTYN